MCENACEACSVVDCSGAEAFEMIGAELPGVPADAKGVMASIPDGASLEDAFIAGFSAGKRLVEHALSDASDVTGAWLTGDITVLGFADGSRSKVTYDASYGYAYDAEKAIMAAMLKRLLGNRYISAIRKFAHTGDKKSDALLGRSDVHILSIFESMEEEPGLDFEIKDEPELNDYFRQLSRINSDV